MTKDIEKYDTLEYSCLKTKTTYSRFETHTLDLPEIKLGQHRLIITGSHIIYREVKQKYLKMYMYQSMPYQVFFKQIILLWEYKTFDLATCVNLFKCFFSFGFISELIKKMSGSQHKFRIGDPVWAKMKGFSPWPGKVK